MHSMQQQWPDCPYPIALICNGTVPGPDEAAGLHTSTQAEEDVAGHFALPMNPRFINVGTDAGWGANLVRALEQLDTDYVIYLQEDYFLDHPVSTHSMQQHLGYCETHQVDYLRLGWPWYDDEQTAPYCTDDFRHRYALCLQPAIWRASVLKRLSGMVYDGWEFERTIKQRIRSEGLRVQARVLHSSRYPHQGIQQVDGTAIRKGLWTRGGERFLIDNGFGHLIAKRGVEGSVANWLMHREHPLTKLPAVLLLRLMKRLKINF